MVLFLFLFLDFCLAYLAVLEQLVVIFVVVDQIYSLQVVEVHSFCVVVVHSMWDSLLAQVVLVAYVSFVCLVEMQYLFVM